MVGFVRRSSRTQSSVTQFVAGPASSTPDETCFTAQDCAANPAVDIASVTGTHGEDSAPVGDPSADEISAEDAALIRQLSSQNYTPHLRSRQSSRLAVDIASDTGTRGGDSAPVGDPSADGISPGDATLLRQLRLEDRMFRAARSNDGGGGKDDGSSSDSSMDDVVRSADEASDEEESSDEEPTACETSSMVDTPASTNDTASAKSTSNSLNALNPGNGAKKAKITALGSPAVIDNKMVIPSRTQASCATLTHIECACVPFRWRTQSCTKRF